MPPGRPRAFCMEEALDRALDVFWRKGYEGTTLPDLTSAMGINRPSLYAAFGNKEELFRLAVERYEAAGAERIAAALAEPTARACVAHLVKSALASMTDPEAPRGCFLVQGALACGDDAEPLRRELAQRRCAMQDRLTERFAQSVRAGDLPPDTDPEPLARYVMIVMHGLSVQASGGAKRADLERAAQLAIQSIPQKKKSR